MAATQFSDLEQKHLDVLVDMELSLVVLIPAPVVNIVKAATIRTMQGQKKNYSSRETKPGRYWMNI